MALIKGNKPITKSDRNNKAKIDREQDPAWPYLKKIPLSLYWKIAPFVKLLLSLFLFSSFLFYLISIFSILEWVKDDSLRIFYTAIALLAPILIYMTLKFGFKYYGRYGFWFVDGPEWAQNANQLPNRLPFDGEALQSAQLVTSRYLITPGPFSENSIWSKVISWTAFLCSVCVLVIVSSSEIRPSAIGDVNTTLLITIFLPISVFFTFNFIYVFLKGRTPFEPSRFFIFDRKEQRVSFHTSLFFRSMESYPWQEFEARKQNGKYGKTIILIHVPTGNLLDFHYYHVGMEGPDALDAYSYLAGFMDLTQSLPEKNEFKRYLPNKVDSTELRPGELFESFDSKGGPKIPIDRIKGLSAKEIWNAAHKYNRQPDWEKWVRDKWGMDQEDEFKIPDNEKFGEPEWFDEFYSFLKENRGRIRSMGQEERIAFTQDWFEENLSEWHWVDPVTLRNGL